MGAKSTLIYDAKCGICRHLARLTPLGDLPVGTSIGIVTRSAGVGATELIAAADRAMYAAKREGGGRISFAAP